MVRMFHHRFPSETGVSKCLALGMIIVPLLLSGLLGSGTLLIHIHHDEDLHTHRVTRLHDHASEHAAMKIAHGHEHERHRHEHDGHDHEAPPPSSSQLVLILPDLHRVMTSTSAVQLTIPVRSQIPGGQTSHLSSLAKPVSHEYIERSHSPPHVPDRLTNLLLTANTILI